MTADTARFSSSPFSRIMLAFCQSISHWWSPRLCKRERPERASRKMIRATVKQMYATVSDSRDEEFATSAGWLNCFLCRNNFTYIQLLPRSMPENSQRSWRSLWHFHPGWLKQSGIKRLSQIATWSQLKAWSVKWLKQINAPAIIW